ncbi:O-antigen ligase family protein [Pontibacter ramchanderi]|uniref:O-antigen ligase-related domain-containing protein n=1 Tax=Pontibacter ramchanderi TaxID=1179743 RepID=A0A2N3U7K9_9BACT|nr:O-antigen ligase family protein [Pontibacter ramchanderi]PKV62739.1 hypothetical protein BD749_3624 [Pontibacter ramchanderi]
MLRKLIGIFIVLTPFTSYFAVSSWLRLPVIVLLILVAISILAVAIRQKIAVAVLKIDREDFFLLIFLLLVWMSWLFGFGEGRSLNHAIAYTFAIGFYYFIFRMIVNNNQIDSAFILKHFAITSIVCCGIIILDWTLVNLFSIGIRDYFVNVENNTANMLYFQRAYFFSVGGVAEEPGSMALLLNITAPLGLLYFEQRQNSKAYSILLAMYGVGLFCLFSTAGLFNLIFAVSVLYLYNLLESKKIRISLNRIVLITVGLVAIIIIAINNQHVIASITNEISQKLSLNTRDASASIRTETWYKAFRDWRLSPLLGNGPGHGVQLYGSGYHSVYFSILADLGILSILAFGTFMFSKAIKVFLLPLRVRFYVGIAFVATFIHFAIVGDFYHAPFWILLILIGKLHFERSQFIPHEDIHHNAYL